MLLTMEWEMSYVTSPPILFPYRCIFTNLQARSGDLYYFKLSVLLIASSPSASIPLGALAPQKILSMILTYFVILVETHQVKDIRIKALDKGVLIRPSP